MLLEVTQGGAAAFDRISQDFDNMSVQLFDTRFADALGSTCWMDAREKQRFGGVDVANPNHYLVIHDDLFDRCGAFLRLTE